MRFAIGATALLAAAFVRADDEASSSAAEAESSTSIAKPTFTVSLIRYLSNASLTDTCRNSPPS